MKKTLIVVDMQNDFIDMALGTPEAVKIVSNVKKKIEEYKKNGDEVIFTRAGRSQMSSIQRELRSSISQTSAGRTGKTGNLKRSSSSDFVRIFVSYQMP